MTNKAIVLIAWLDSTPLYWEQLRALIAQQPYSLEQRSAPGAAQDGCLTVVPLTVAQIVELGSLIQLKMQQLALLARKDTMILCSE